MYEEVLQRMRHCARQYRLIIPRHARIEMRNDGIGQYDIEYAILIGRIVLRQRDRISAEYKYRIKGAAYDGRPMEVVAKLIPTNETVLLLFTCSSGG